MKLRTMTLRIDAAWHDKLISTAELCECSVQDLTNELLKLGYAAFATGMMADVRNRAVQQTEGRTPATTAGAVAEDVGEKQ